MGIAVETLAVFVRFWLATTPALPEPAAQAARAKAAERYDAFVTALGRRLAKGPKLRQEISEDVNPTNDRASNPSRLVPAAGLKPRSMRGVGPGFSQESYTLAQSRANRGDKLFGKSRRQ